MNIDIHTLVFILVITHFIQIIVFTYQYIINKNYHGIEWWLMWSAAEVIGFIFLLLRDIPSIHVTAIIFQNSLIISGVIFLYIGIMRFFDKKENRKIIISIFGIFLVSFLYFLFVNDNIQTRGTIIAATLSIISFVTVHALIVYKPKSVTASAYFTAAVFFAHGCFFAVRTVMLFIGTPENIFGSTILNIATYIDALVCSILWTFVFIVMVNQRLNSDMKEAKEEMEIVFNTSPDSAIISRLIDGLIIYTNEGFSSLTGFTRNESVGNSTLNINIWVNQEDRQRVVSELSEKGFIENFESRFQRKDKSQIVGLLSAKIINLQNIPHIISVTRDITELKKKENELKDVILKLQKALEEIRTLRGILPICANCKKIKDDKGYWEQVESYISKHSEAEFSHLICPDCMKKLYPEFCNGNGKLVG